MLASSGWVGAKRKPTILFSLSIDFPYMPVMMGCGGFHFALPTLRSTTDIDTF